MLCQTLLRNLPQGIHFEFEQRENWSQLIEVELAARNSEGEVKCYWKKESAELATQSIPYSPEALAEIVRRSFLLLGEDLIGIEIQETDPSNERSNLIYRDFYVQNPITGNEIAEDSNHPDGIIDSAAFCLDNSTSWCYSRYERFKRPTEHDEVRNIQKRFADRVRAMQRIYNPRDSRRP